MPGDNFPGMAAPSPALQQMAREAAAKAGIPWELFFGLIQTESAWNPGAISPAGARGITQVMPKTAASMGFDSSRLTDPAVGLAAGAEYLRQMLQRFDGSWALAAMAYNGGPGAPLGGIKRAGSRDPEAVGANLKHPETRAYWKKVLTWAAHYAGRISATQARINAGAQDLKAEILVWAEGAGKSAAPLVIFALVAAAALIMGGRPRA